jgi:hypothetical protein
VEAFFLTPVIIACLFFVAGVVCVGDATPKGNNNNNNNVTWFQTIPLRLYSHHTYYCSLFTITTTNATANDNNSATTTTTTTNNNNRILYVFISLAQQPMFNNSIKFLSAC